MQRCLLLFLAGLALAGCRSTTTTMIDLQPLVPASLPELQERAGRAGTVLSVPTFETSPAEVAASTEDAISQADDALKRIASRPAAERTFTNTIVGLDDALYSAGITANRLALIKETSTNAAVRAAATDGVKKLSEWSVGIEYREDLYQAVRTVADARPQLDPVSQRLLDYTLRDYRRAGLALPAAQRAEVERLRKELTRLTTDFEGNINRARGPVKFTRAELGGMSESFLAQPGLKTGVDEYTVMANVTFQYIQVLDQCRVEASRRRLMEVQQRLAAAENGPLLQQIVELRDRIGHLLGYASWADYQIEPKMARNAATARKFLEDLSRGLQPKFDAEREELRALKAQTSGNPQAVLEPWDVRYFQNELKKTKYAVDKEQLRVFFPYERTLRAMFGIYERIFSLRIQPVTPPVRWAAGVDLYAVSDAVSGEPLGLFYLDMFPRDGKYNHFAQFGIIEGKRLPDGRYQRPTAALVCNFPTPEPGQPSLLPHDDVETLFHEFGHALHTLFTQADYARFSGTSVPRDFVEAPSQMLENWVWDQTVLDTFATDYQDPNRRIPGDLIQRLKQARQATQGFFYRRQISFGLLDLALHQEVRDGKGPNVIELSNRILSETYLPVPPGSSLATYFGHLSHYDAGYYGYAWAEAISHDMATVFEKAPEGFLDVSAGRKLRNEIYAVGNTRDVDASIRLFLGRDRSIQPFLESLGIGTK